MAKDINDAVREVCLSFPEAEQFMAHGSPNFRVRGKTFAMYTVNHHGDGRVSLWLNSPPGAQGSAREGRAPPLLRSTLRGSSRMARRAARQRLVLEAHCRAGA
jgi:hypothetical protein